MSRSIEAIAMDFDGVLTDGTVWWGPGGEEWKRLSYADVMGVSLGSRAGIRFGIISGEDSPLIDRYAAKMGIVDFYKGCKDKRSALEDFARRLDLDLAHVAYVGDDVNDLAALAVAGLSAAPADAHPSVRRTVHRILEHRGGHGAIRELVDALIQEEPAA